MAREAEGLRRDLLGCREQLQKMEHERNGYRDKCGELETRVTELNELLNLELAKGYDSEQQRIRMREDFERARQDMEREVLLRHGDRERELL